MGNRIVYGQRVFEHKDIKSGNCYMANALSLDELAIDTLEFTITSTDAGITSFQRGAYLDYYYNENLVGRFYVSKIERVSPVEYHFTCSSVLGLLDEQMHYGGLYNGVAAASIIADIMGAAPYVLNDTLGAIAVYGWLPIDTRRANLHQVLFAIGGSVLRTTDGLLHITVLSNTTAFNISADRFFTGGNIAYLNPASEARITEHAYAQYSTDEVATLFDGTSTDGEMVSFDGPMYGLAASGTFRIKSSGVNYAVLSAGTGKLTGKRYTHTTKVTVQKNPGASSQDNTVTVDNATLVSLVNASSVAKRVMAYHGLTRSISEDIVLQGERPGQKISFVDPFREAAAGFIESLDIVMSNKLRASMKVAADFVATKPGNFYEHVLVVSTSRVWTIPAGTEQIRVILIGGGQGGTAGGNGGAGGSLSQKAESGVYYAEGGAGGSAGSRGSGGKIFEVTLQVAANAQLTLTIGTAGASGGTLGGNTTCVYAGATYTSDTGLTNNNGYTDIITGNAYALPGNSGKTGGRGGNGGGSYAAKQMAQNGGSGGSVGSYRGGSGGGYVDSYEDHGWSGHDGVSGGGGGGAAEGANGSSGASGTIEWRDTDKPRYLRTGSGGNGANAAAGKNAAQYGGGGDGGNGGGGGGGAGGYLWKNADGRSWGNPGTGGTGAAGGRGAGGCVIIYY